MISDQFYINVYTLNIYCRPICDVIGMNCVLGGLCFAYNCDLFYRDKFPHIDLGTWLFVVTFIIGGIGVIFGGIVSDKVVAKMGIKSRVAVLAISQVQ